MPFLRSLWPDLVFGNFTYVYHGSMTHLELSSTRKNYFISIYFSTGCTGWGYTVHWHSDFTHLSIVQPTWIQVIKLKDFRDISLKMCVSEIYFPAADTSLESAMSPHPVPQRQTMVSPPSHSTNLGHCQGYLQPKEGNAVSYHKTQSCHCRCLMCTLLWRSVLSREALPSSYGRTDVSLHPQVKLQLIMEFAQGNVGQEQIPWHWTQLCVTPVETLLTTYTILHKPLQGVP